MDYSIMPLLINIPSTVAPQPVTATAQVTVTTPQRTVVQPQDSQTFSNRLKSIVGCYSVYKRRAIQCAVLFEANRALESKNILRPRYETQGDNILSMAKAVIDSCTWIPNESREEILYRTMTKRIPLNPEVSRKRLKENILNIKRVLIPAMHQWGFKDDMSHEENCKAYLQDSYVSYFHLSFFFAIVVILTIHDNNFLGKEI